MQALADKPRFWWRVLDAPAPWSGRAPMARLAAAGREQADANTARLEVPSDEIGRTAGRGGTAPRRATSRRPWFAALALLGGLGLLVWSGGIPTGAPGRSNSGESSLWQPLVAELDRLAIAFGLELAQVSVAGHRYTPDTDILEALRLGSAASALTFDVAAARVRLERLPWVATARIRLRLPDVVEIGIAERTPLAIWENAGRLLLVDATGRELGGIGEGLGPMLPTVRGVGAPAAVAGLLDLLAEFPAVAHRLRAAERVGERRWSLHLVDGGVAHLPELRVREALAGLQPLLADGAGAAAGPRVVDLRLWPTLSLRPAPGAGRPG